LQPSRHCSGITPAHVSIHCLVFGNAGSPHARASEPPPRESRATSTTCRAEAPASEAQNRPRQTLLGRRPSGLVRMETIVNRGYTRDCGQVAPGRFPVVLAADLQGQDPGGEKTDLAG